MMGTGLLITFWQLHYASGIDKKILKKDMANGTLSFRVVDNEELFWYHDVLNYVWGKWEKGNVDMYPLYGEEKQHSFGNRLLEILDDGFSPAQIKGIIKLDNNGRRLEK